MHWRCQGVVLHNNRLEYDFTLVDDKYYQLVDIPYKTTKLETNSQENIKYLGIGCFKMKLWH